MGLFSDYTTGGTPGKRVTKKELEGTAWTSGLYGHLKTGDHKLNDRQFKQFKSIVTGFTDADDHMKRFGGINEKEVGELVNAVKTSGSFSQHQIKKIEEGLRKKL